MKKKKRLTVKPSKSKKTAKPSREKISGKTTRKRKRLLKKLIFLLTALFVIIIVLIIYNLYRSIQDLTKPLYISPVSTLGLNVTTPSVDKNKQIIEKLLKANKIEFNNITKDQDSSYIVHLNDEKEVVVWFQKDIYSEISSLQLILFRLTMEGKQYKRIDLRFDRPVITF